MIGRLRGRLVYRAGDHVMIDVGGVGYLVYCSERTLAALPRVGEAVSVYTDLVVREDLMQLFGFLSLVEKEWHRLLMGVQGVGAKVSLAILGTLGPDGVSRAIALGDWSAVKAAKGVGPKTAQRIVLDLKDKAPAVMSLGGEGSGALDPVAGEDDVDIMDVADDAAAPAPVASGSHYGGAAQADALSALGNLGYGLGDAAAAVATARAETPDADATALIRAALKLLEPKG